MNKIILMGRLVAEPETRHTQSNKQVTSFRLAVNRGGKQAEGQPEADFFNCTAWEKTAEFISKYFHKGKQVAIEGRMQNNDYTDKDNVKHYAMQVVVQQAYFAEGKRDGAPQDPPVNQDGVGGQGYYQQPANGPDPWEQQAQQQYQQPAQAPQGQYQQQYQQAPQQPGPGFGSQAAQQPRQPWQK